VNSVLTFLHSNRQRLDLDRYSATAQFSSIVLTPRFRASSHVVFLVMAKGKSEPLLVAKVPRLANASASIEREVAGLRAVQSLRPQGFDSIPRVIAFEPYCGYPLLVETALVGQPMDPAAVRRDLAGCCETVLGWLAEVQQPAQHDASWFARLAERPLHYFEEVFPLSAEEARRLLQTLELVAPLRDMRLPLVFEHGDLSHPNIMLLRRGGLGVVDWELAEPQGLPAYDLFCFLVYAAFAKHNARAGGDYLSAFQTAFFGRAAWARPYMLAYAKRLGLPTEALTPLFILCWGRYVANLLMRLGDADAPQGRLEQSTADWLRANRYYALWRYSVTHVHDLAWHDLPATTPRSI
jgi:aminoglycoside phosphotransferase